MFQPKTARATLLPLFALLAAGCDNKDDNPAGPGGTGQTDLQTFQEQAILTFDTADGVATSVDEIAHGDFSTIVASLGLPLTPARAEDFQWAPNEGAWILNDQGSESDATSTTSWNVWAWIQFRNAAGTPQAEPDATTAAITIELDWDIHAEAEENGEQLVMDLAYTDALDVSGMPDGPYPVEGAGSLIGHLVWSAGQDAFDVTFDMGWALDLLVPDNDGCPSGTITVSLDQYEAVATYAGSPSYSWVVTERGVVMDTGSEPLDCGGVPAGTSPIRVWDRWSALRP